VATCLSGESPGQTTNGVPLARKQMRAEARFGDVLLTLPIQSGNSSTKSWAPSALDHKSIASSLTSSLDTHSFRAV
jgi:hypothetical protein